MLFMIDRFAVYVTPLSEQLEAGNCWTVSWRIDDIKQLNETVERHAGWRVSYSRACCAGGAASLHGTARPADRRDSAQG